jgi:hypothetical protein
VPIVKRAKRELADNRTAAVGEHHWAASPDNNGSFLNYPTADERYHKRSRKHGSGGKHHFASDYHGVVTQRSC